MCNRIEDITRVFLVSLIFILVLLIGYASLKDIKQPGIDHVRQVCEETGMYLTEGYAISCHVLKDPRS